MRQLTLSKQFKNMIYISCNPETFLRDMVKLDREIESIGIFDQLQHLEHTTLRRFKLHFQTPVKIP